MRYTGPGNACVNGVYLILLDSGNVHCMQYRILRIELLNLRVIIFVRLKKIIGISKKQKKFNYIEQPKEKYSAYKVRLGYTFNKYS